MEVDDGRWGGCVFLAPSEAQREPHVCTHRCGVEHVVGNLFRCAASGATHICDATCDQRVLYDPTTAICRLSKRLFPLPHQPCCRKRSLQEVGWESAGSVPHVLNPAAKRAFEQHTPTCAAPPAFSFSMGVDARTAG